MNKNDIFPYLNFHLPKGVSLKDYLTQKENKKLNDFSNKFESVSEVYKLNIHRLRYYLARFLGEQENYNLCLSYTKNIDIIEKNLEKAKHNDGYYDLVKLQITYMQVECGLEVFFDSSIYELFKLTSKYKDLSFSNLEENFYFYFR